MSNENSIYTEYFSLTTKYKSEYGDKTVVLLQVGAFFEIYGLRSKEGDITGSEIEKVCEISQLNISEKKALYENKQILMAGFRDYTLEKYINKLTDAGYTIPVYIQQKDGKTITRVLDTIYSSGTLLQTDTNTNTNNISNNIMCVWFETYKPTGKRKNNNHNITHDTFVCGMSVVNIFTGNSHMFQYEAPFYINTTTFDELDRYMAMFCPSELIIIHPFEDDVIDTIIQYSGINTTLIHKKNSKSKKEMKIKHCSEQTYIKEILTTFFNEDTYDVCSEFQTDIHSSQSFCYLLNFIQEHNPELVRKISIPNFNNKHNRMILANHTLAQLNIIDVENTNNTNTKYTSIVSLINQCGTAMGRRRFYYQITNPTFNEEWLNLEYKMIDYLYNQENDILVQGYRTEFKTIRDTEKISRQLVTKKAIPSTISHLYDSLYFIHNLNSFELVLYSTQFHKYLCDDFSNEVINENYNTYMTTILENVMEFMDKHFIIENCKLTSSMTQFPHNIIQRGISEHLDNAIIVLEDSQEKMENLKSYFNAVMQKEEKTDTEYVRYHETERSGVCLQITTKRSKTLQTYLDKINNVNKNSDSRSGLQICLNKKYNVEKQNITFIKSTSSNVIIDSIEISELTNKIQIYKEKVNMLTSKIYIDIIEGMVSNHFEKLERISHFISKLDLILTKTYVSKMYNYCRPNICEESEKSFVDVKDIRHPLIEQLQTNELYVTNDICLGGNQEGNIKTNGILLYGTNAVGKTSLIRAIGISVIMAQAGMYVPCSSFSYKPYTAIFSRILGNDNLFKGLSTFAVEMSELRIILKMADNNSLVLGDELCSGTELESALSIFVSGLIHLSKHNSCFIFATHFHEVVDYEEIQSIDTITTKHMSVKYDREQDCLIYDRKLQDGSGPRVYGLEVCKSLHMDEDFLESAYNIRNKYYPDSAGGLNYKKTTYNSKKVRGICEICKNTIGSEIHHLQQQSLSNKEGYIHTFHKNHPANLVSICESCHNKIHNEKNPEKTKMIKKKTTIGYQLSPTRK